MSLRKTAFLLAASAIALTTARPAMAQTEEDFFARDRYTSVAERAQPDFDPEPIRVRSFVVRPELAAGLRYETNLFATENDEVTDTALILRPSIEIVSDWSRHEVGLSAGADLIEYADTSDESRTGLNIAARGRLDVSRRVALGVEVRAAEQFEPRTSAASVGGQTEPIEFDTLGVDLTGQYRSGRIELRGRFTAAETDFQDVRLNSGFVSDQDFRDNERLAVLGRASYAVRRDIAVFVEATAQENDYDAPNLFNPFNRDFSQTAVRVGANFELPQLIRGDIGVGYLSNEYDDDQFSDADGLSVVGNLSWFVTQLTTISASALRDTRDPGLIGSAGVNTTQLSVRGDHELLRNVVLFAEVAAADFDFEDINRDDERIELGFGGRWKLNKQVWLEAGYRFTDQDSNVQPFTDNQLAVSIRLFP